MGAEMAPYVIRLSRVDSLHLMRLADKLDLESGEDVIYYMIAKFLDANPVRLVNNHDGLQPQAKLRAERTRS